ncbi:MAG: hypothetical protein R3C97_11300 [Geminicoccaceae bacterium]
MTRYELTRQDSLKTFQSGLPDVGPFDFVSEHGNSRRRVYLLGQSLAFGEVGGFEMPLVVDWRARVVIPQELDGCGVAKGIVRTLRERIGSGHGRWLVDIRTEARTLPQADVYSLVMEDIERGELPNRLLFHRGIRHLVLEQVGRLKKRVGVDPAFNWRRVRVHIDASA